jgi:hypothetical protein
MLEALQSSRFLFIIPEKHQKTSQSPYRELADFASGLGVEVYMIDIRWKKHNSLLECALEATKKVHEIVDELRPTECYFFGFGIGAMLAVQVSYLFRAKGLMLCSMPALFQEELTLLPWLKRYLGRRRIYNARNKPGYPALPLKFKTCLLYTEKERKTISRLNDIRDKKFPRSQTIYIQKTGISLRRKKYMAAVKEAVKSLLS